MSETDHPDDGGNGNRGAGTLPGRRQKKPRPEPSPAQRAMGMLVRREHSRRELERKLTARGVPDEAASQAVDRLAQAGWQDDGRFAVSLARSRACSGYGPVRIRAELETHGLDGARIEAAFSALAEDGLDDWNAQAADLVARRFGIGRDGDLARRRKAADFLLRRGFDVPTARRATGFSYED